MAWTQQQVDALAAAVASGVLTVRFEGPPTRMITYQSLGEMRALLAEMRASVSGGSGGAGTTRYVSTRKGV